MIKLRAIADLPPRMLAHVPTHRSSRALIEMADIVRVSMGALLVMDKGAERLDRTYFYRGVEIVPYADRASYWQTGRSTKKNMRTAKVAWRANLPSAEGSRDFAAAKSEVDGWLALQESLRGCQ